MKNEKTENPHVLYIPSFRFAFSDSTIKHRKRLIKFPLPYDPLYLFSLFIRNMKKGITEKQHRLHMPSFALPFGVIQLGKQIRNQAMHWSFSD